MSTDSFSIQIIGSNHKQLTQQGALYSSLIQHEIIVKLINSDNPALTFSNNELPNILIFLLESDNIKTLDYLSSLPTNIRPSLVIIASSEDSHLMRHSMQAGARDFFLDPVDPIEIKQCLTHLITECEQSDHHKRGKLITVINAKGGSGASLIACNLAHISAITSNSSCVLLDMDLQFGTQSLLLDLKPKHTLVEALNDIDDIDFSAIEGYMARHKSGLRLLSTLHDQVVLPGEIAVDNQQKLLDLSLANYDHVFVDLPRLIDPLTACILDKSDQIIVVVQQTLAHMRDAKRLMRILKSELNIAEKNIIIIVNRYNEKSSLTLKDIQITLECHSLLIIPNDYEKVATSTNLGIPLLEYAKKSPITYSLIDLVDTLGVEVDSRYKKKSFFKKLFGN